MNKTNHSFLTFTNKILAGLLSLLGFSLAACDKAGECEYGSPHADYEIKGKVTDLLNKPIANIQIEISDSIPEDTWTRRDTIYTNTKGEFLWESSDFPRRTYQLISKDIDEEENGGRFKTDTTFVSFKNVTHTGGSSWYEGAARQEVTITMK